MGSERNWRILLIGGSSGTGKTNLAHRLSRRFNVTLLQTDDVRMAIQRVTLPEHMPALHFFLTHEDVWSLKAEEWRNGWIGVGEIVSKAMAQVIAHHLVVEDAGALIIEGDSILPHCVMETCADLPKGMRAEQVRAVFLYETDPMKLADNLRQRTDRGFPGLPLERQLTFAHSAWTFGLWLKAEAERLELPVVNSCPWGTLDERAEQAIR